MIVDAAHRFCPQVPAFLRSDRVRCYDVCALRKVHTSDQRDEYGHGASVLACSQISVDLSSVAIMPGEIRGKIKVKRSCLGKRRY